MPDWNEIKAQYICAGLSNQALAKQYGVGLRTLYRHAKDGGWYAERLRWAERLTDGAVDKALAEETDRLAEVITATTKAVGVALATFNDKQQFQRYLVSEDAETKEKVFKKTDTKALREMTLTLRELTEMMREFYNLPTPEQRERRRINSEQLSLARMNIAPQQDKKLTVRFENTEGAEK